MAKNKTGKTVKHKRMLDALRDVIASLPTAAEKEEVLAGSKAVLEMLADLRAQVELLPTVEDMAATDEALARLQQVLNAARSKPALSAAIGQALQKGDRERAAGKARDRIKAEALLENLRLLPVDEIQTRLRAPQLSDTELRSVAAVLGLRPTREVERESLVHQVAMSIANYRGYQQITGQVPAPADETRKAEST
jgi:hypothetical protein